ncbi:hypothetical protein SANTM175S_07753 [Streptomyces antimycoticus]
MLTFTGGKPLVADRWRIYRLFIAGEAAYEMPPHLGKCARRAARHEPRRQPTWSRHRPKNAGPCVSSRDQESSAPTMVGFRFAVIASGSFLNDLMVAIGPSLQRLGIQNYYSLLPGLKA